jgi:L-lactate utilization protein LutC
MKEVFMDFSSLPAMDLVQETVTAVGTRGISVELVDTKKDALERIKAIIPAAATVMTGASLTLREIGFEDLLVSKNHPWKNLKDDILAEKDQKKQSLLRKQAIAADYFLGSVHAVSKTGEIVVASATGSQIAPYAFASQNIIWVVGIQKITQSVDQGLARIREYIMPHEEERMRAMTGGKMGTTFGKVLIFAREVPFLGRTVRLMLVKEKVGD